MAEGLLDRVLGGEEEKIDPTEGADPLKAWGDVLAQQGHPKEALAKYDQALKYAPNWQQLKAARAAAAKHKS
jgi:hypothetical protein